MSGRLVSAVFDSALPAWLKPYAAACASFAQDDGSRVYPTVQRIARMVGRCERATQTAIQELRRRGVLTIEAPPGRYRATRYHFQTAALPQVNDGNQYQLFPQLPVQKTGQKFAKSGDFHSRAQALTSSGLHPMGAVGCTRSVNDPSVRTTHRRGAKKTGTA